MPFIDAERTQLFLRCALFGPSGSGKTMTALRMAKGIAEKMGVPFAVIDTEARSASKYANRFSFKVENLKIKTVDGYIASMKEAADAGFKVLVIDSLSHAWRELTEEVDRIAEKSNSKNTFSPWAKVNPKQKRFIDAILNYPGHIIATMRSKTEWVIGERKDGKNVPEKIGLAPEQGKGLEYEFDLLLEMDQKHQATVTKDRTGKFQDETVEKPGEDFGVALYNWLNEGTPVQSADETPEPKAEKPKKAETEKGKQGTPEPAVTAKRTSLITEISTIITAEKAGASFFTEDEKEQARQLIKATGFTAKGNQELQDLKGFLADELTKRESKKAA